MRHHRRERRERQGQRGEPKGEAAMTGSTGHRNIIGSGGSGPSLRRRGVTTELGRRPRIAPAPRAAVPAACRAR
jgi:hypothetical protein